MPRRVSILPVQHSINDDDGDGGDDDDETLGSGIPEGKTWRVIENVIIPSNRLDSNTGTYFAVVNGFGLVWPCLVVGV